MTAIPAEAVTAAATAIERELMSGKDYAMAADSDEALARVALEAAAPVLAEAVANPAVRLLEEALFLRMNGEYAPGGNENWHDWDRKAEVFLRGLLLPAHEDDPGDH